MRVWINNPFDLLPGEGARPLRYESLARALVARGHTVVWWTSDWSHIRKVRRTAEGLVPFNGIEIRLIPTIPYFRNVGVRRFYSHWCYARMWLKLAQAETERPDRIVCSLPPLSTGLYLRRICNLTGAKGLVDVMDLWPDTFARVLPTFLVALFRLLTRRIYGGADGISAVGRQYLDEIQRHYPQAAGKPVHVCYHGIQLTGTVAPAVRDSTAPLRLVYIGNMSGGYDLKTVASGVSKLLEDGCSVELDIAGEGALRSELERVCQHLPQIRFHGLLGEQRLGEILVSAAVGIIPMDPASCVAVPYKLGDYAKYGLAMINSLNGSGGEATETESLLVKYHAGVSYRFGDVSDFIRAVRLYLKDRELVGTHGHGAYELARTCFDSDVIYPAYCEWIENFSCINTKAR